MGRVRIAWLLWLAGIALAVATLVLIFGPLDVEPNQAWGARGSFVILGPFIGTLGLMMALRDGSNPIGWCYLAGGTALVAVGVAFEYGTVDGEYLPGAAWVALTAQWVWAPGAFLPIIFGLLLSPTGSLPSPRWAWVGWLTVAGLAIATVGHLASPLEYGPDVPNPLVSDAEWAEAAAGMGLLLVMVAMVGALVAIVLRFRRGSHNERQRLKWVVFGAPLGVLLVIPGNSGATGRIAEIAANVGVAIVFASITAAVLRYRLYDIDLIINRTLVYGALTVTLASAYFAAVVVFSQATRSFTPDSDIAIALSTLIVAGLFGPLRTRLQAVIDRRFYRSRYDALRAAEGFSVSLRNTVDIRSIEELFVDVVEETLQPEHSALWIEERV